MPTPEEYILGTGDDELDRLGLQHRLWGARAAALWTRAGFAPGQAVMDVGAGPGFAALDLSRLLGPAGRVIALDSSPRFVELLKSTPAPEGGAPIEVLQADATTLELPPASLDGAWARWVLCFVRDPEAVVAAVSSALRPGGVFAVQDYFNWGALRLVPGGPAFDRLREAIWKSHRDDGADLDVGSRLPGMMRRHGLAVREMTPVVRIARPGEPLWEWPGSYFRNFVPRLVSLGALSGEEGRAVLAEWEEHTRNPDAFFMTPPQIELVADRRNQR